MLHSGTPAPGNSEIRNSDPAGYNGVNPLYPFSRYALIEK